MGRPSRSTWAIGALVVFLVLGGCRTQVPASTGSERDLIAVVHEWDEARNAGDIDAALALLSPSADALGFSMESPERRAALIDVLRAQAVAGWRLDDHDCRQDGDVVACRYQQDDAALRRWGLTFTGTHEYTFEEGVIARVKRVHDDASRDAVYAALADFKAWVRETHPDLLYVIWSDATSSTYATPEGARAMLEILDEYTPPSGSAPAGAS